MTAWLLLSVTMVGLETTLVFWSVWRALRTSWKSEAENTALRARAVLSLLTSELRLLKTLSTVSVVAALVPRVPVTVVELLRAPVVPVVEVAVGVPLVEVTELLLVEPLVWELVLAVELTLVVPLTALRLFVLRESKPLAPVWSRPRAKVPLIVMAVCRRTKKLAFMLHE